jgi:energy-coupling factor transporter ATP-binding protein EcfA2
VKARENPFTTERVIATIRYTCPDGDLDTLIARLAALGYRAAIVGPHGAGKTTLLEDLGRALQDRGFRITSVRLSTDERRLPSAWPSRAVRLGPRDIVCLDGAEQLSALEWLRFRWRARRAGGLIVTSHARGRLPLLIECTTSADLLERIVRRLSPAPTAGAPSAAELFRRHHGNLRDALRELYDFHAAARRY